MLFLQQGATEGGSPRVHRVNPLSAQPLQYTGEGAVCCAAATGRRDERTHTEVQSGVSQFLNHSWRHCCSLQTRERPLHHYVERIRIYKLEIMVNTLSCSCSLLTLHCTTLLSRLHQERLRRRGKTAIALMRTNSPAIQTLNIINLSSCDDCGKSAAFQELTRRRSIPAQLVTLPPFCKDCHSN